MLLGGDAMLKRVMTGLYALVVMSGWVVRTGSLSAAGAPKVYVGLFKDDAVAVIDTAQNKVVSTISVPKGPHGLVMTPDGRKVYVSSDGASTASVIDTATDRRVSRIAVGTNPRGPAISADGSRVPLSGWRQRDRGTGHDHQPGHHAGPGRRIAALCTLHARRSLGAGRCAGRR